MHIFLDLSAARNGGQLTRARWFLECLIEKQPNVLKLLTIVGPSSLLHSLPSAPWIHKHNIKFKSDSPILNIFFRVLYENLYLPFLIYASKASVYLTFSHSLPFLLPPIKTVVGVSTVAPFISSDVYSPSLPLLIKNSILKFSIVQSCKRATSVIALSHYCRQLLISSMISPGKILVVPNGTDHSQSYTDSEYHPPDFKYLLAVSHFYPYKNFEVLVLAYSLLPESIRNNYKLIIAGQPWDKAYAHKITDLISTLQLQHNVFIYTDLTHDQLPRLYQSSELFVFTSLVENCPNILLEALASRVPVLSCDIPPMTEFGGSSVLYFPAHDSEYLSSLILSILLDPDRKQALSDLCYQQSKQFSWQRFTADVIAICEKNQPNRP